MSMDLTKLKEPFPADEIEWRIGQCGKNQRGNVWAMCLAYVSARAIMNRLDDVCGPGNWKVSYRFEQSADQRSEPGVIAQLSIKVGEEWVTKEDGAEQTDIESFKGGISGALKRAGAAWGIGRYLYELDAGFADISMDKKDGYSWAQTKDKVSFYWHPPALPPWALPKRGGKAAQTPQKDAEPPKTIREERNRAVIGAEILKAAEAINCPQDDLAKWAQDEFKKPVNKLTTEEMEKFLEMLLGEQGRQGEIA